MQEVYPLTCYKPALASLQTHDQLTSAHFKLFRHYRLYQTCELSPTLHFCVSCENFERLLSPYSLELLCLHKTLRIAVAYPGGRHPYRDMRA